MITNPNKCDKTGKRFWVRMSKRHGFGSPAEFRLTIFLSARCKGFTSYNTYASEATATAAGKRFLNKG